MLVIKADIISKKSTGIGIHIVCKHKMPYITPIVQHVYRRKFLFGLKSLINLPKNIIGINRIVIVNPPKIVEINKIPHLPKSDQKTPSPLTDSKKDII